MMYVLTDFFNNFSKLVVLLGNTKINVVYVCIS